MKTRLLALAFAALFPSLAFAQMQPSGHFTPGHAVKALNSTGSAAGDAGGANGGPPGVGLTELGITNTGLPLCVNSGPTTSPYYQICMGANSQGGGLIAYEAKNGATPLGLNIDVNGAFFPFPGPGNGNVVGPSPDPTAGHIVEWNGGLTVIDSGVTIAGGDVAGVTRMAIVDNQTSAFTVPGASLSAATSGSPTAQEIYNQAVLSGSGSIFQEFDGSRGVGIANANSTVNIVAGVAGYTLNNTVPIGQRTQTAAVQATAVCAVNSSQCWGFDALVSDNPLLTNTGITAGTGKFLTNEFDLNITSPSTTGNGLAIGGTALPTSTTLGINGVAINKLWGAGGVGTGTALFANGFIAADACCAVGLNIGASALTGAAHDSMPVFINYRAGNNTEQNISLTASASGGGTAGTLFVGGTGSASNLNLVSGSLFLPVNSAISFNNNLAIFSDGTSLINIGTNAPYTALAIGNSSSTTLISGTITGGNIATGTPTASLCLDGSNHIIKKTTSGACI